MTTELKASVFGIPWISLLGTSSFSCFTAVSTFFVVLPVPQRPITWTALLCFLNVGAATSIFDVSKKRRWLRGNVGLLLEGRRNVGLLQEAEEMSGSVGGHIRLLMAGRGAGEKGKV